MLNALMEKILFARGEISKNWSNMPTAPLHFDATQHGSLDMGEVSPTLLAALHIYERSSYMVETLDGYKVAIADTAEITVVELQKEDSQIEAVVYQKSSGVILAVDNNRNTGAMNSYVLGNKQTQHRGVAVLLALLPTILSDAEARNDYDTIASCLEDPSQMILDDFKFVARLSYSTISRMKSSNSSAKIEWSGNNNSGNIRTLNEVNLPAYTPNVNDILVGTFHLFSNNGATSVNTASYSTASFKGTFATDKNRNYTDEELEMIPKLSEKYILPQEIVDVCECVQMSTGYQESMRNFMLEGPAGTGKTAGAKAIAYGLNLPYTHITCHAGSEIYDFIGTVFPATDSSEEIHYEDLLSQHDLPSFEDIEFDLEESYKQLTGEDTLPVGFDKTECYALLTNKLLSIMREVYQQNSNGKDFIYTETNLIKALKHGYLCEIQEPTVIVQPGVLVGLNSLLEQNGSITLPTGEVIKRHPECVIIVTTNTEYEGCRDINQSVISRMDLCIELPLPPKDVLVDRAMAQTGVTDIIKVTAMVDVMLETAEHCRLRDITDGSCGPRELYAWIKASEILGDPIRTCRNAFLNKVTRSKEDREEIYDSIICTKNFGI